MYTFILCILATFLVSTIVCGKSLYNSFKKTILTILIAGGFYLVVGTTVNQVLRNKDGGYTFSILEKEKLIPISTDSILSKIDTLQSDSIAKIDSIYDIKYTFVSYSKDSSYLIFKGNSLYNKNKPKIKILKSNLENNYYVLCGDEFVKKSKWVSFIPNRNKTRYIIVNEETYDKLYNKADSSLFCYNENVLNLIKNFN